MEDSKEEFIKGYTSEVWIKRVKEGRDQIPSGNKLALEKATKLIDDLINSPEETTKRLNSGASKYFREFFKGVLDGYEN